MGRLSRYVAGGWNGGNVRIGGDEEMCVLTREEVESFMNG